MKAISLHQPFAWAIFAGHKGDETRGWAPPRALIGQRIAIHAAGRKISVVSREIDGFMAAALGQRWRMKITRGALLGTVRLAGYTGTVGAEPSGTNLMFGDWTPGRYAWRLEDPIAFEAPVPMKGFQRWWNVELGDDGR